MALTTGTPVAVTSTRAAVPLPVLNFATSSYALNLANVGSAAVYWGDATVTTTNGQPLAANATVQVQMQPGDVVYLVCGTTSTVNVAYTGA